MMTPTTLQIASDIHLERRQLSFDQIITPNADILALVGDIGSPFEPRLQEFLAWCSIKFTYVFFVPGNHEYYNTQGVDIATINQQLHHICSRHTNVIFMYNRTYVLGKYAFIGSILWSEVPQEHKAAIQHMMNDYRYIFKQQNIVITPDDTTIEYHKNKQWIEQQIIQARNHNLIPIILTHHTPSFIRTSAPEHDGGISKYAFSSKLTCPPGVIRLWCCGHTHYNFHHSEEGYELISNQFGYGNQGTQGYKKDLRIIL